MCMTRPVPKGAMGISHPPAKNYVGKSTKFSSSVGKFAPFCCHDVGRYSYYFFILMTLKGALVAFIRKGHGFKNSWELLPQAPFFSGSWKVKA